MTDKTVDLRISTAIPAGMIIFMNDTRVTGVLMPGEKLKKLPECVTTVHFSSADFPGGVAELQRWANEVVLAARKSGRSSR